MQHGFNSSPSPIQFVFIRQLQAWFCAYATFINETADLLSEHKHVLLEQGQSELACPSIPAAQFSPCCVYMITVCFLAAVERSSADLQWLLDMVQSDPVHYVRSAHSVILTT